MVLSYTFICIQNKMSGNGHSMCMSTVVSHVHFSCGAIIMRLNADYVQPIKEVYIVNCNSRFRINVNGELAKKEQHRPFQEDFS